MIQKLIWAGIMGRENRSISFQRARLMMLKSTYRHSLPVKKRNRLLATSPQMMASR